MKIKITNKHYHIIWLIIFLLLVAGIFYFGNKSILSESEAIARLQSIYPEFMSYPSDRLPPQSIRTQKEIDGRYVTFVQEGSGRPILRAKCFFVSNVGKIRSIGEFTPEVGDTDFSITTCKKMN